MSRKTKYVTQKKIFEPKSSETIVQECIVCKHRRKFSYNGKGKRPDPLTLCPRCKEMNNITRYARMEVTRRTAGYKVTVQKVMQHEHRLTKL